MRTKAVIMLTIVMFIILFCCKERNNRTERRYVEDIADTTIVADTVAIVTNIP